jgi:SAM-dependent methyltransferase
MTPDQPLPQVAPLSPYAQMVQMSQGHLFTQALYVMAKLGVADLLAAAPRTSRDLAAATGMHALSLYRVLRTLAGMSVLREEAGQTFRLTPLGATLQSAPADSLRNFVLMNGASWFWQSCGEMLYAVQTGDTGAEHALGTPIFAYLAGHPDEAAIAHGAMVAVHGPEARAIATAYDLSTVTTLVDVGGGYGNLLIVLLAANPQLQGILFEQPHVVEEAAKRLQATEVAGRCEVIAGDFFASVPKGGDAYLLSHVVHDWDGAHLHTLLGNCHRALAPGGRLLLVEMVLPGPNQPSPGRLLDLVMLTMAGGQERTAAEYEELLGRTGFHLTRVVPTDSPVSVIEAVAA